MRRTASGGAHRDARDADHDRAHREVLAPPGVLAEHPLREEYEHYQARRERWLNDDERREQERDDLEREAEYRHPRAEQPARAPQQPPCERQTQVLIVGRVLGLRRLERDP